MKFSILIMIAAAIGMIHGLKKQKAGYRWGKPLAVGCACVALLFALVHISSSGGPNMNTVIEREMSYQMIGAKKLGLHLAEKYPNAKALIIVQPSYGTTEERTNAILDGLKEGFGNSITVVDEVSPDIPAEAKKAFSMDMPSMEEGGEGMDPVDMIPPLEYWYTAEIFDKMARRYAKRCDLIVTTIGLPQDIASMEFWQMEKRPKLAIASGSVYELKKAIKGKAVVAVVTYSPQAVYEDKAPPEDLDEAFNKRFLLVTPDNVDDVSSKFPDLFMK